MEDEGQARTGIAAPLAAGAIVAGRYRLESQLGAGGFGAVWRAHHLDLQRDVALKLLHPELARDPDLQRRFLREVEVSTSFVHRYAVQVRDAGRDTARGLLYLTMDLVEGRTLAQVLRDEGPLAPARAVRIAVQSLEALGEAHRTGLVHRDLKPHNLMLARGPSGEEEARLLDFGIARAYDSAGGGAPTGQALTVAGGVVGTIAYMSPEQAQGMPLDARSDLYSLAVTLYEALARRLPIEPDPKAANSNQSLLFRIVSAPPRELGEVAPQVPAPLRAVVMRALAKDPADRFADASALRSALLDALDERPETRPPPPEPRPPLPTEPIPPPPPPKEPPPPGDDLPTGELVATVHPETAKEEPAASPPRRGVLSAAARTLVVALVILVAGGLLSSLVVLVLLALGAGGSIAEALQAAAAMAGVVAGMGAILLGIEELGLRARGRARGVLLATLLILLLAGAGGAALVDGHDRPALGSALTLIALPLTALALARSGGLPGARGAPLLVRWQLLLGGGAGALAWGLMRVGLIASWFDAELRCTQDRALGLLLLAGLPAGIGLCLAPGDALARKLGLDPRPAPAAGSASRALGCAAWTLLLSLAGVVLLATRGLQVGIDVWPPELVLDQPAADVAVSTRQLTIEGQCRDGSGQVTLRLTRREGEHVLALDPQGAFRTPWEMERDLEMITLVAEDGAGNRTTCWRAVGYRPPEEPEGKR